MQIIESTPIGDAELVYSTIAEPDAGEPAAWVGGTAYAVGERVRRAATHRIYRKIKDGGDHTVAPEDSLNDLWFDEGAVNRWAMFQIDRNTASTSDAPITIKMALAGRQPALALFGVKGQQVTITVRKDGAVIDTRVSSMRRRDTRSWSQYFWGGFTTAQLPTLVIFDMLPVADVEVEITVGGAAGPYALSAVVIGQPYYIGAVDWGATDGAQNYSRMEREFDGSMSRMIRRRSVERGAMTVVVPKPLVLQVRRLRQRLNSRVAVYSGLDDKFDDAYFEPVLKLGFYKQFDLRLDNAAQATLQLEVEEI